MASLIVPEFAVSDVIRSRSFYCDILGFECVYDRPEEGFCYLTLDGADLMLDQIGDGRTFEEVHLPTGYPFGKGVNIQIQVKAIAPLVTALGAAKVRLFLDVEDRWYRRGELEVGNRQFVVPDPDGYLLRFFEPLLPRAR